MTTTYHRDERHERPPIHWSELKPLDYTMAICISKMPYGMLMDAARKILKWGPDADEDMVNAQAKYMWYWAMEMIYASFKETSGQAAEGLERLHSEQTV